MQTVQLALPGYPIEIYAREAPPPPWLVGNVAFFADGDGDWLVEPSFITVPLTTVAPRSQRILVVTEPGGEFPSEYVNQFGVVVSPFQILGFRGHWIQNHGALPSLFGVRFENSEITCSSSYEDLNNLPIPLKTDAISAVVSRKTGLPGHRRRLELLRYLSVALGDRLHLFGRGHRPVIDKAEAILPFAYHLVLENTQMSGYWTEKLADAYLGYAFPIVSGPPDLERWFPSDSFLAIDANNPAEASERIVSAMNSQLARSSMTAVRDARRRILHHERLFHVIARIVGGWPHPHEARLSRPEIISPPPRKSIVSRYARKAANAYWKAEERFRSFINGPRR